MTKLFELLKAIMELTPKNLFSGLSRGSTDNEPIENNMV